MKTYLDLNVPNVVTPFPPNVAEIQRQHCANAAFHDTCADLRCRKCLYDPYNMDAFARWLNAQTRKKPLDGATRVW